MPPLVQATIEVEVYVDGVVETLLVEPGQKVAVGTVMAVIRTGIRVHSGRELRDLANRRFVMLAVYWHPDLDIVISVDTTMRPWRAVSVLSRDNWRRCQERKVSKPKRRKHDKPGGRLRRKPIEKKWRFR